MERQFTKYFTITCTLFVATLITGTASGKSMWDDMQDTYNEKCVNTKLTRKQQEHCDATKRALDRHQKRLAEIKAQQQQKEASE